MDRTIGRRLIHTLHLVETNIPRFRDRPSRSLRLMETSHLVQEMVTWRHRSISRLMPLFTKYARKAPAKRKVESPAARKTHSASTGLALEQISGFRTQLMSVFW